MADPSTLLTPTATTPDIGAQVAALATEAAAEVANGTVAASTVTPDIGAILTQLESGIAPSAGTILAQLAGLSQPIAAFVTQLQQSIATAKEGTIQGLLLAQQLQQSVITVAQFQSDIAAITLTPTQLTSAIAANVNTSVTQLLGALVQEAQVNTLAPLISVVSHGVIPSTPAKATLNSVPSVPAAQATSAPNGTPSAPATAHATTTADTDSVLAKEQPDPSKAPVKKLASVTTPNDPAQQSPLKPTASLSLTSGESAHIKQLTSDKNQEIAGFFASLFKTAAAIAAENLKASLASFLSLKTQPQIMTGARAIIRINGAVSGLCTNCSYEINSDWQEIRGLDDLLPNDLAPTTFSVRGQMSLYRKPNGSAIDKFLTQDMFQGIIWPYTTIEIRDKRTDELILLLKRCAITSHAESYRKGELTTTNLSFVSIGMRDEHIPQLLPDTLPKSESGTAGLLGTLSAAATAVGGIFGGGSGTDTGSSSDADDSDDDSGTSGTGGVDGSGSGVANIV